MAEELTTIFSSIDDAPLASASIAQVHAATLHDGREVVIKILRPGVEKLIQRDIALLYGLARFLMHVLPGAKRIRPKDIVAEFEKNVISRIRYAARSGKCVAAAT